LISILESFVVAWSRKGRPQLVGSQSPLIIVPKMTGSIIGVYNGKTFNEVEIKPEMITHYLAELSISHMEDLVLVRHSLPISHMEAI
jgi:ribosomal protein S19